MKISRKSRKERSGSENSELERREAARTMCDVDVRVCEGHSGSASAEFRERYKYKVLFFVNIEHLAKSCTHIFPLEWC